MTTIDLVPHMDAGAGKPRLESLGFGGLATMASVTESAGAGSEGRSIERPYGCCFAATG